MAPNTSSPRRLLLPSALCLCASAVSCDLPSSAPAHPVDRAVLACGWDGAGEGRCEGGLLSGEGADGSSPQVAGLLFTGRSEVELTRIGERQAMRTRQGRRDAAEIDAGPALGATFEEGFTVAVLARFDGVPEGRAALVSQWATRPGGRAFELGMEWDGYPYLQVSRTGEASNMGIVYAEQPLERSVTTLLSASFTPGESLAIYANGVLLADNTAVVPAAMHRPEGQLLVGMRPGCGRACTFDGAVGDVLIWDEPLGRAEHRALAESFGMTHPAVMAWSSPEPEVFDLDELSTTLRDWYRELDAGQWPGAYRWSASDSEPQLYSSADVAWIRWMMADLGELTEEERRGWVAYLQSFQDPFDGSYPPQRLHDRYHALAHVTAALNALDGDHRYWPSFVDPLVDTSALDPWLESLDWYWQWGGSCTLWGAGMVLLSSVSTPPEWGETLFAWLDREVDPELGAWRRGHPVRHQVDWFGGGFHIWTLYVTDGRPLPYPERIIDLVLALQRPDGDFDRKFGCGVLDGVWALAAASRETSYRAADVDLALRRSLHGLMDLVGRGRFLTGSHGTLSRVATLAILQGALPEELQSTEPWREPWTESSLFELGVASSQ